MEEDYFDVNAFIADYNVDFNLVADTIEKLNGYTSDLERTLFVTTDGKLIKNDEPYYLEAHDVAIFDAISTAYNIDGDIFEMIAHKLVKRFIEEIGWIRFYAFPSEQNERFNSGEIGFQFTKGLTVDQFNTIRNIISQTENSDIVIDAPHGSFSFKNGEYRPQDVLKEIRQYVK